MSKINIIILLIALFVAGCHRKSEVYRKLEIADTLLYNNYVDSARMFLDNSEPLTMEDSAYYYVLKAETDYRQGKMLDTNEINYSINYYKHHNDNRISSNALYYKACAYIVGCNLLPNDCFILLKQAEHLSEKTSDNSLKNKICAALSYVNHAKNQMDEALTYARKEFYYAKKLNCRRDIAYALIKLSIIHQHFGQKDSAEYYIMQCKMLVNEVNDDDKSYIYNMLGECFMHDNPDSALQYFNTALMYNKNYDIYQNIAKICLCKNDTLNWRKYCDSALANAWYQNKIDILSDIAQMHYASNDIVNYKCVIDQLIESLKDFNAYEKANFTLEIQKKFDFERQQTEYEKNVWLLLAVIFFLVALSLVVAILYIDKSKKFKRLERINAEQYVIIKKTGAQIKEKESQLLYFKKINEEITSNNKNNASIVAANIQKIDSLQKEIDIQKIQHSKYVEIGKTIYERIKNAQSIVSYKEHFANCVYYFEVTYPDKTYIFAPYTNLTIDNKIFLICDDATLEHTDAQIAVILEIKESTVRSRRTKLKEKLS